MNAAVASGVLVYFRRSQSAWGETLRRTPVLDQLEQERTENSRPSLSGRTEPAIV